MATIRRRSRGKWEVQIRKGGIHVTKTFTFKHDAQAWARKIESEIEWGIYQSLPAEDRLVRDLLKRYENQVVPNQKSVNRTISRLKILRTHLGDHQLSRLDSVAIAQYRDTRLKLVGGNTVRKELTLLQTILDLARKEWGVLLQRGNPFKGIAKPKVSRPRDRRLRDGEEAWLLAALKLTPKVLWFHDLRHEATSRFSEMGLVLMEVAAITGHRDLRMLQRYTHLRAEELVSRLDHTRIHKTSM